VNAWDACPDLDFDLMSEVWVLSLMWEMLAIGYERDVSSRIRVGTNLGSKLWDGGPSPSDSYGVHRGRCLMQPIESGVFQLVVSSWFSVLSWVVDEALKNPEGR
jgi:hypothetical protein